MNRFARLAAALTLFGACASAAPASAQEDFYAGKTIDLIVPASAGGSYGIYALLLSNHLGRHIPGNPTIVPEYMSGAGGMRASNQFANVSEKDGTALYLMHQNAPTQQLLQPEQVRYDAAKMIPVGILTSLNSVLAVRLDSGMSSVEDATAKEIILGSTGRGSYQFIVPTLLNEFLGTKFKVITTYSGTGETMLALERGEIGGMMTSLTTLQESRPGWVDGSETAKVIMQVGETADPAIPDVPRLTDLAKDDEQRSVFRFLSLANSMGRSLVLPDGVPEDRVEIIRKAFTDMLNDPEFKAEVAERKIPVTSGDAAALGEVIKATLATDPKIVETAKKYMSE